MKDANAFKEKGMVSLKINTLTRFIFIRFVWVALGVSIGQCVHVTVGKKNKLTKLGRWNTLQHIIHHITHFISEEYTTGPMYQAAWYTFQHIWYILKYTGPIDFHLASVPAAANRSIFWLTSPPSKKQCSGVRHSGVQSLFHWDLMPVTDTPYRCSARLLIHLVSQGYSF